MNRKKWLTRGVGFFVVAVAAVALITALVMSAWNGVMPELFGWRVISFWQALGLLFLSRILLGGFRGFRGGAGRHAHWRHRMLERFERMTPEEREQFRSGLHGMRGGCGSAPSGAAKPAP
jgi:hypothetical protein